VAATFDRVNQHAAALTRDTCSAARSSSLVTMLPSLVVSAEATATEAR
jgi:hypothetical protein